MQILSPSLACCLILLTLPFTQQKVLILMKSSQSIIFFMVYAFCVVLKSHCHIQGQLGFLLHSRSFIILHFKFRCEICMDLIFVKGVSSVSRLIFYFIFFWHVSRCKELTHLKRPWCWERLNAGGEGDDRGWNGCMASPTQWTWVWVSSRSWWWTGRPGVLQSKGSQKSDMTEWPNWTES